ncbi:MAG: RNase H [Firmicutes bacterium]|nr:RNase H [Bacillota bacterium]
MGKKIYAVLNGKKTGLFDTWAECQKQVIGFSKAKYKSFPNTKEGIKKAKDYLKPEDKTDLKGDKTTIADTVHKRSIELSKEDKHIVVYVDGSYGKIKNDEGNEIKVVTGGAIFVKNGEIIDRLYAISEDQDMAQMQNVAGEILSSVRAIDHIIKNKIKYEKMTIIYDYQGIEKWATGEWKRKKIYTEKYHNYVNNMMKKIKIDFIHCPGHKGNIYNEEADRLAGYAKDCYKENSKVDMEYFLENISVV